ncbi:response regulator [Synoicihabitans lomoniglobus]|uniref:Response regulator n=1 Tax=Synoicihabitans lomoniglobus TaxID=2909285 RepID=A0AAE9ZTV5_9BACT|nr:response regulator [Opitutaceae bacterium LMO-M01]WED64002.1 response regulator [Opitutaceae bacterium LMO-M01]
MTFDPSNATLLVVDDVPENIDVLFDDLTAAGYHVLVCDSGKAALETLEVQEPDLILLDVMMPGLDGLETCRRLKQMAAGRDVPVFFMTALDDPFDKVRGIEAGAIDYLTKPVFPNEVLARIQAHLEIRQLQKSLHEQNDRLDAALQRSIKAETALKNSLTRAMLVVTQPHNEILFSTRQAQALVSRHGGQAALQQWLEQGVEVVNHDQAPRLHISRRPAESDPGTLLITLEEEAPPPRPDDLLALGLTPKETETLFWVAQGKTNPEIAVIVGKQLCTVKKNLESILLKLRVETRLAAALRANELFQSN